MKILHVVDLLSQETGGGSAKVPYYLAREQAFQGHTVTIYCSDHDIKNQLPPEGVKVVQFHSIYYLFKAWNLTPGMLFADFKNFDVVHLHNYRTIVNLIPGLKADNIILQAHGNCQKVPGLTGWVFNLLWNNIVFKNTKGFIADAHLEVSHYLAEGGNVRNSKVIPVGIDMPEYFNLPKQNNHKKKQILYLGKLYWIKGADILARAVAFMDRKDIELVVTGFGFGNASFKNLVKELGIEDITTFTGPKFGVDKIQAYMDADVYVMPSRYEMWGISFMEALACGTPVIMTKDCQAWTELPPYCGHSVHGKPAELARAISFALDEKLADRDRQKRIDWVSKYDWPIIAEKVTEFYKKVLK